MSAAAALALGFSSLLHTAPEGPSPPSPEQEDSAEPRAHGEVVERRSLFEQASILQLERAYGLVDVEGGALLAVSATRAAVASAPPRRVLLGLGATVAWEQPLEATAALGAEGERLFVWEGGALRALDLASGSLLWRRAAASLCADAGLLRLRGEFLLERCDGSAGRRVADGELAALDARAVAEVPAVLAGWLQGPGLEGGRWAAMVERAHFERRAAAPQRDARFSLWLGEAREGALRPVAELGAAQWSGLGGAGPLDLLQVQARGSRLFVLADAGSYAVVLGLSASGDRLLWRRRIEPEDGAQPVRARQLLASPRHVAVVLEAGRSFVLLDAATGARREGRNVVASTP